MRRVLLLTPSELTTDPRARRQAAAARARGLAVVGVCGRLSGESPAPLAGVHVARVGRRGRPVHRHETAIVRRDFRALRELRGLFRLTRLVVRTLLLARAGLRVGEVDVVHANDFDTLPAAWIVARRRGARLVYDAHELYSAFEPFPPLAHRAASLSLERVLARRAAAVVTVSDALADELVRVLRLRERPLVVLNAAPLSGVDPRIHTSGPLRAIYQGAFGPGRPLEDLLDAVRSLDGVRLAIRVVRTAPEAIAAAARRTGVADRVDVLEPLPPDRLVQALADHEVGVLFDRPETRNSELGLPNKLFDYLMAGLAVVAPRLPGLAHLVESEQVGILFDHGGLRDALAELERDRERLASIRRRARALAVGRLNAEAQSDVLARAWGLA